MSEVSLDQDAALPDKQDYWSTPENQWHRTFLQIGTDLAHYARQLYVQSGVRIGQKEIEDWESLPEGAVRETGKLLHDWTESRFNTVNAQIRLQDANANLTRAKWLHMWKVKLPDQACVARRALEKNGDGCEEIVSLFRHLDRLRCSREKSDEITESLGDAVCAVKAAELLYREALDAERDLYNEVVDRLRT